MLIAFVAAVLGGSVTLRADAEVRGPTVELGEVAEIRGLAPEEAARIAQLDLGFSPAPGALRPVQRDDVARALRTAGFGVALSGAPLCRARPCVETVTGSELEAAARQTLAALFAGRDVELAITRPTADLPLVAPERQRELRIDLGRRDPLPGAWSVPVDVIVDGARVQTVWVPVDVQLFERQPVATRDLRRGEPVEATAWSLERVRVQNAGLRAASPDQLFGATCTRDLARGARIQESDVHREPLVRMGDLVEIEVVRGAIRARARAVARGQGALGDRVEVQTGESQRRLVGVVVERGLVRVELAESPRIQR